MKFFRFLILLCVAAISGTVGAQNQRELGQLMRDRGEYYFTLSVDNPAKIQAISEICSIDGTDGRTVVAYANQKEYEKLLQAGYQLELQTPPSLRANVTMWDGNGTYNWDTYLTYTQYVSMMEEFPSKALSDRACTLINLGTLSTSNHRQLLGVRINNGSPEGKPKFLYTSTMHGDEITGMILMLRLIDELCTSTDSRILNLLNDVDVYIFPLTNPDGTYNGGNNTVNSAKRYNGNNIDLNRNYKDYHQGAHPDGNDYEDETIWTMAFGDENLFTMSANYHGGAEVMNYPWDAVYDDHADRSWYEYVCTEYVQNARQVYSSYMSDTYNDGVTGGADWYVITGSRQDYMNAYAQCREVTVECSSTKTPTASQLPNFWNYNHNSMLAFMEQVRNGVHGFVYDAVTGLAIEGVKVTVENHDDATSFVTSHSVGDFHRPIKGGTYTFTFTKSGYYPQSVQVTVADGDRVDLNIQLVPDYTLSPDFTASSTIISMGESIDFTDASNGTISSWNWTFEGGTPSTSTEQNPSGIVYETPGNYSVTLTVTGPNGDSEMITKENYITVGEASYNMSNTTVTTCSGLFYDSGGPNSDYTNNLTYTMTFYPQTEGASIRVVFSEFNTESGYDYLYIYDGTSTSATQIGRYDGTTSPGTVTATNSEGALTFKFTSDQGVVAAGWFATVSCVTLEHNTITATANPVGYGTVEGAGSYVQGETCTLTATPASGYVFANWTENGTVVSTDDTYSFQVTYDRTLVANFIVAPAVPMSCYYPETNVSADTYVMGYLNGSSLYMLSHNNSSNVTTSSVTVTSTDYGFSVEEGTTIPQITLTAYGSNGQYYISYNGRYLARSNGSNLTWGNQTSNYGRWYINANGIYITTGGGWGGNTTYYLYFDASSNSFKLSTSSQNNIVFYTEGDCPIQTVQQTVTLNEGWTWWSTYLDIDLTQLEDALGTDGLSIVSQNGTVSYLPGIGWDGSITYLDRSKMYQIHTSATTVLVLNSTPVDPASTVITIAPGFNWIGYPVSQSMGINEALSNFTPTAGDFIKSEREVSMYSGTKWVGSLTEFEPGKGYIYKSYATQEKTFIFSTVSK
jgi:PKD repeat protein